MSDTQKAAEPGATQTGAETKPDQGADVKPKVYGEDYVKSVRDEAKVNREKAEKFEAELKAAQLEVAKAKGDVEAIRKLEGEQRQADIEARERKIAELSPLAAKAAAYEQTLKAEADARLAGLPEAHRSFAASLPIEQRLEYARLHSNAQGAAPGARTVGAPGSTQAPFDPSRIRTPEEAAAFFRNNPKERRSFLEKLSPNTDPFSGRS